MDLLVLVGCVLLLIGTAAIWGWRFLVLLFLAGNLHTVVSYEYRLSHSR
jgi:hypothetical protein